MWILHLRAPSILSVLTEAKEGSQRLYQSLDCGLMSWLGSQICLLE